MNILLLTDFSSSATHAHRYALELYKNHSSKQVFLLHVKKPCLTTEKCSGKCKLGLHQKLMAHANQLSSLTSETVPTALLTEGSFIDEVRSAVAKHQIDVLIIGAKGQSSKNTNTLGSHPQAIANKVKCPSFIVFEDTPIQRPTSALFPVNYTDALYPVCLNKLKSLPAWESISVKILELKPKTFASHLFLSSKQILEQTLKTSNIEYAPVDKDQTEILKEAEKYNVLIFAAKNLSVGSQIFSELKAKAENTKFNIPLFVLHA